MDCTLTAAARSEPGSTWLPPTNQTEIARIPIAVVCHIFCAPQMAVVEDATDSAKRRPADEPSGVLLGAVAVETCTASVRPRLVPGALCVADVAVVSCWRQGDVLFHEARDTILRPELEAMLLTAQPAEILVAGPVSKETAQLLDRQERGWEGEPAASSAVAGYHVLSELCRTSAGTARHTQMYGWKRWMDTCTTRGRQLPGWQGLTGRRRGRKALCSRRKRRETTA